MPAEVAGQRPLLERAAAGDREAFVRLYDGQVEGVYRYLLAWTGDRSAAKDLTEQVFIGALTWLPVTAGGEGEAGAWLIAMARDAIVQQRGSGWEAGPVGPGAGAASPNRRGPGQRQVAPRDAVGAVALLGDPEREVVVLRLLLGHSLAHTAHLSGYSQRAVIELQLAACLAIRDLTGLASPVGPGGFGPAEEFERRLRHREVDLSGSDPGLAQALAVAAALRSAIPGYVVAPDDSFVQGLRLRLVAAAAPEPPGGGGSALGSAERALVAARRKLSRRPWVATFVATTGIVGILALQAFGSAVPPSTCGGRPCPAPTMVEPAGGGGLGTPLTTIREPATTSSTLPGLLTPPTAQRASTAGTPPTTRPATTAPQTTRPNPTTTRAPTTTGPPTTPPTTTTGPPATTVLEGVRGGRRPPG